jgi:hypothetical protein
MTNNNLAHEESFEQNCLASVVPCHELMWIDAKELKWWYVNVDNQTLNDLQAWTNNKNAIPMHQIQVETHKWSCTNHHRRRTKPNTKLLQWKLSTNTLRAQYTTRICNVFCTNTTHKRNLKRKAPNSEQKRWFFKTF